MASNGAAQHQSHAASSSKATNNSATVSVPELRDNVFTFCWVIELARDIHNGKLRLQDVAAPLPQESEAAFADRTSAIFREYVRQHQSVLDAVPRIYVQARDENGATASAETDLLITTGDRVDRLRLKNTYIVELIDGLTACRRACSNGATLEPHGDERISERFKRVYSGLITRNAFPSEPPLSQFEQGIEQTFEKLRGFLIDTGLRANAFINWHPSTGDRGIEIVGESSVRVFHQLVESELTLELNAGAPAEGIQVTVDESLDLLALKTAYEKTELDDRLLGSHQLAKSYIENRGTNALYIALGMLHWTTEDEPTEVRKAPIILVPVELHRENATTPFHLKYCGDELEENRPLAKRLAEEFGINLPPLGSELDPEWYFEQVREALGKGSRFSVHQNEIVVDFFPSSARMYEDLDTESWRPNSRPWKHPLTVSLLGGGFSPAPSRIPADGRVDEHIDLDRDVSIFGCDSSQERALVHANDGNSQVLIGPPGSGKSFAIAEFLAQVAAQGKTAIFQSAKAAALEVVERRLKLMGLGDLVLAVPRHDVTKRTILDSLRAAVALGEPEATDPKVSRAEFKRLRTALNAHADALAAPIAGTALSPYEAAGFLLTAQAPTAAFSQQALRSLQPERYPALAQLIEELSRELVTHGRPEDNPYNGSRRTAVSAEETEAIAQQLETAELAVRVRNESIGSLCTTLSIDSDMSCAEASALVDSLTEYLAIRKASPAIASRFQHGDGGWFADHEEIVKTAAAGERSGNRHAEWDSKLKPTAWNEVTKEQQETFDRISKRWYHLVSIPYWLRRHAINSHFNQKPASDTERRNALAAIVADRADLNTLKDRRSKVEAVVGPVNETAPANEWGAVRQFFESMVKFEEQARTFPHIGMLRPLFASAALDDASSALSLAKQSNDTAQNAIQSATSKIGFSEERSADIRGAISLSEQLALLTQLREHPAKLESIARLNTLGLAFFSTHRESFFDAALRASEPKELPASLHFEWVRIRLDAARKERQPLKFFDVERHERLIEDFVEADKAMQDANARALVRTHWEHIPRVDSGGQVGALNRELSKRNRNRPIAELFAEAPRAVQAIKPIMLMTPRAAAEFLPRTMRFDHYVGDEESQKELVEGLGGMLRANHALVVGDNQQMAPSRVFKRGNRDENPSVLDQFIDSRSTQFMLTGSYRFADPTLVQCSNVRFYGGRLRVFPAPFVGRTGLGLKYNYEDNRYEGGGINTAEAIKVAEQVMQHARETPELSLGVAAFSQEQASLILKELEKLRRKTPDLEDFFSAHPDAPFSVKNLENVQGDEHDVMFISTAYGKSANGKLRLTFGTLNQPGGEKGLNVLFTRAKLRCELFTAIDPDQIDLRGIQSEGVKALKAYLEYAKSGTLEQNVESTAKELSSFEKALKAALESRGHEVHTHIGTSACHVNLAVVDPRDRSRYLIGILVDGAQYQQAHSARERNRINEEVLSSLGWRLRREWSLAWLDDREEAVTRLQSEIEWALQSPAQEPAAKSMVSRQISRTGNGVIEPARGIPYELAEPEYNDKLAFDEIPAQTLGRLAREIVTVESPVHVKEVMRRIRDLTEVERVTVAVEAALSAACDAVISRSQRFARQGDFLYTIGKPVVIRDRSAFHPSNKKVELIAPEELRAAVLQVVTNAMGIPRNDIPFECVEMLGFKSLPQDAKDLVIPIVDKLLRDGVVHDDGGRLVLTPNRSRVRRSGA